MIFEPNQNLLSVFFCLLYNIVNRALCATCYTNIFFFFKFCFSGVFSFFWFRNLFVWKKVCVYCICHDVMKYKTNFQNGILRIIFERCFWGMLLTVEQPTYWNNPKEHFSHLFSVFYFSVTKSYFMHVLHLS